MRYYLLIVAISFLAVSCNKDKFTTKPQLKFKSINREDVSKDDVLQIKLSFTDKEGDVDSIYVEQFSINCPKTKFHEMKPIPPFSATSNTDAEFLITYGYRVNPALVEPQCEDVPADSCYFKFAIRDKAGNKSDTVQTDLFILHRQ
jgi:hypothetical protein